MSGNVGSYARVLNGAAQMSQIKNFNDLAASIAEMNRDKAKWDEQKQEEKKKIEAEKAEKKRQQKLKEQEDRNQLKPGCLEDVEVRGKVFVLNCNVPRKKDILKYYFDHDTPLYKLAMADVDQLIEDYFGKMESAVADAAGGVAAVGEQGAGVELVSQGANESASAVAIESNEEVAMDGTDAATDAAEAVAEEGAGVELVSQRTNESANAVAIDANEEVAMDEADASTAAATAVVAQGSVGVNKTTAAIDANDEVPRIRRTGRKSKLSEKASAADENL